MPSAAKIEAYSQPAGPLPMTRMECGSPIDFQDVLASRVHPGRRCGMPGGDRDVTRKRVVRPWPRGSRAPRSGFSTSTTPRRKEAGTSLNPIDTVSRQIAFDGHRHQIGNLLLPSHQQRPRVLSFRACTAVNVLVESREVDCALAHDLRRDAGRAHREAAGPGREVDERNALSEICGLGRSLFAGRAGSENDQIVVAEPSARLGGGVGGFLPEMGVAPGAEGSSNSVPRMLAENEQTYTTGSQPTFATSCLVFCGM